MGLEVGNSGIVVNVLWMTLVLINLDKPIQTLPYMHTFCCSFIIRTVHSKSLSLKIDLYKKKKKPNQIQRSFTHPIWIRMDKWMVLISMEQMDCLDKHGKNGQFMLRINILMTSCLFVWCNMMTKQSPSLEWFSIWTVLIMILHKVMENIGESLDEYYYYFFLGGDHFYNYKFIFSVFLFGGVSWRIRVSDDTFLCSASYCSIIWR